MEEKFRFLGPAPGGATLAGLELPPERCHSGPSNMHEVLSPVLAHVSTQSPHLLFGGGEPRQGGSQGLEAGTSWI
jgi:hypothetical protein